MAGRVNGYGFVAFRGSQAATLRQFSRPGHLLNALSPTYRHRSATVARSRYKTTWTHLDEYRLHDRPYEELSLHDNKRLRKRVVRTFFGICLAVYSFGVYSLSFPMIDSNRVGKEEGGEEGEGEWWDRLYERMRYVRVLKRHFAFCIDNLLAGRLHVLLTSAVTHSSFENLASGMIGFMVTARYAINAGYRAPTIMAISVGSEIAGNAGYALRSYSNERMDRGTVGSSGLIAGMATAAMCTNPRARVLKIIPVWLPVGLILIGDFVGLAGERTDPTNPKGRVSHSAHVGGAVFGAAYYFAMRRGPNRAIDWATTFVSKVLRAGRGKRGSPSVGKQSQQVHKPNIQPLSSNKPSKAKQWSSVAPVAGNVQRRI
ncbi:Uu.00g105900.m01.CDS01 [Anthostomella pinea]|uniref:Uu.00g105900.m01.CDS01 n=1 Tax=Anthostomella pinea TaxID=933095 RepID=A0AAI8VE20_9PEZI|nr:Uu.00g105900.m01.CDS01 [Anthostomella pinea]